MLVLVKTSFVSPRKSIIEWCLQNVEDIAAAHGMMLFGRGDAEMIQPMNKAAPEAVQFIEVAYLLLAHKSSGVFWVEVGIELLASMDDGLDSPSRGCKISLSREFVVWRTDGLYVGAKSKAGAHQA